MDAPFSRSSAIASGCENSPAYIRGVLLIYPSSGFGLPLLMFSGCSSINFSSAAMFPALAASQMFVMLTCKTASNLGINTLDFKNQPTSLRTGQQQIARHQITHQHPTSHPDDLPKPSQHAQQQSCIASKTHQQKTHLDSLIDIGSKSAHEAMETRLHREHKRSVYKCRVHPENNAHQHHAETFQARGPRNTPPTLPRTSVQPSTASHHLTSHQHAQIHRDLPRDALATFSTRARSRKAQGPSRISPLFCRRVELLTCARGNQRTSEIMSARVQSASVAIILQAAARGPIHGRSPPRQVLHRECAQGGHRERGQAKLVSRWLRACEESAAIINKGPACA